MCLDLRRANSRLTEAQKVIDSKDEQIHRQEQALSERRASTPKDRIAASRYVGGVDPAVGYGRGAFGPRAMEGLLQHLRPQDARQGDRDSGYQSAYSKCGSFDARDLDEEYPSEVVEEEVPTRKPDKGGVDPTVKRSPVAAPLIVETAPAGRREKETLRRPKVNDLHRWLALTAAALVEASACDDRAEVAWFSTVNDPNVTFEAPCRLRKGQAQEPRHHARQPTPEQTR